MTTKKAPFRAQALATRLGFIKDRVRHGFSSRGQREATSTKRDVLLPRLHLFEFNDQSWLPEIVRFMETFAVGRGFEMANAGKLVGDMLASHVRDSGAPSILELAAGSAMPSVQLSNELRQRGQTTPYRVSDKYPDFQAFRRASELSLGHVQFVERPVDVLDIPPNLRGLRLMVTSFHHFRPEEAARLLSDTYEQRIPIAIFELTDRRFLTTLFMMPIGILGMFVHARAIFNVQSWRGVLWLLPSAFAYGFDGLVSCLRSYTLSELTSMTRTLTDGYRWRMGFIPTALLGLRITYLLGGALPSKSGDGTTPSSLLSTSA